MLLYDTLKKAALKLKHFSVFRGSEMNSEVNCSETVYRFVYAVNHSFLRCNQHFLYEAKQIKITTDISILLLV